MTGEGRRDEEDRDAAAFAEIVAQLRSEPWPEPESTKENSEREDSVREQPEPEPAKDSIADLPSQWRVPPADSASVLDEIEFEPPEPRPLPSGDLNFWGALGGLIGGPLWLLYLFVFDRYARPLWWVLACAVTVAGLVLIFLRQPHRRDEDWDDDVDGAVL